MSASQTPGGPPSASPELEAALERRRRWMEQRELARSGHALSDPRMAELLLRLKTEAGVDFSPPRAGQAPPAAAASQEVERLREELSCPLCLDVLTEPLILDCGHAFCRSCLETMGLLSPGAARRCPLCRAAVRRPARSLALNNVAERARALEPPGGEGQPPAAPGSPGAAPLGPAASLELLTKRIQIVEGAVRSCEAQIAGFDELAEQYYQSTSKIDAKIACLRQQRDALDLEYQAARSAAGAILRRLDLLRDLLSSLQGERLTLEHMPPRASED